MNKILENKLSMLTTVQLLCKDNSAIWATDEPFKKSFSLLEKIIQDIQAQKIVQEEITTGIAADKQTRRKVVVDVVYLISKRICSYAATANVLDLYKCIETNISYLNSCRAMDLVSFGNQLLKKATQYLAVLTDYGITQALLDDFKIKLNDYSDYISRPREAIIVKENATVSLEELFQHSTDILKQRLDGDIAIFAKSNPEFYRNYKLARKIVGTAKSTLSLRGHMEDSVTHYPLENVHVTIPDIGVSRITGSTGVFEVINLTPGMHNISFSLLGYMPQSLQVEFIHGKTKEIVIPLQAKNDKP